MSTEAANLKETEGISEVAATEAVEQKTEVVQDGELFGAGKKIAEVEAQLTEKRAQVEALRKNLEDVRKRSVKSSGGQISGGFLHHVKSFGKLQEELRIRKEAFEMVHSLIVAAPDEESAKENLKNANIAPTLSFHSDWIRFEDACSRGIEMLREEEQRLSDVLPASSLTQLLTEVKSLHDLISGPISQEASRRRTLQGNIDSLKSTQAKIVNWCRQQRVMLEGLSDPEHVQEFVSSLQATINVMDTNFLVLNELAEPLLSIPEVQELLTEATNAWLGLEVYVFEKVSATIMSQHVNSGVENETSKWVNNCDSIKDFLDTAKKLLDMPIDEESMTLTAPIKRQLKELLDDWDGFKLMMSHLSDFAMRDNALKDYYEAIRVTVFSKLTLLTHVYSSSYSFEKKKDYMDRLSELTDWVQCKSQSEAWQLLQERVTKMKQLIEENEALHGTAEERAY